MHPPLEQILCAGFKVLPVKFDDVHVAKRYLFMKQHKVRDISRSRPPELTLFVCNVPSYCTKDSMKSFFSHCGEVKDVFFSTRESPVALLSLQDSKHLSSFNPEGFKVSYIVFTSAKGVQNALNWSPEEPVPLSTKKCPIVTGFKKWYKEYTTVEDISALKTEINEFMKNYDDQVAIKAAEEKKASEPDEEGWTTVTKGGRRPGFPRKRNLSADDDIPRRKKKKLDLVNFYTFQIKESKMKHVTELRNKFENDKKKIEQMKIRRKFNPF